MASGFSLGCPLVFSPGVYALQNLERTLSCNSSTHLSRIFYLSNRVEKMVHIGRVYSSGRSLIDNVNALIPPVDAFSSRTSSAAAWGALFGDRRNQTRFTPGPNPPLLDRPIHHVDLSEDCGYNIRHTNTEPYETEGTRTLRKCNLDLTTKRTGRDEGRSWTVDLAQSGLRGSSHIPSILDGTCGGPWIGRGAFLDSQRTPGARPAPTITGFP